MGILRLQTASDERLGVFRDLTNHQLRNRLEPEKGLLIAESEICLRVAVGEGLEPVALLLNERKLESLSDVVGSLPQDVPVFVLPREQTRELCGYTVTRGVLGAFRRPALPSMEELLAESRRLVVLEGITDTSNVGAIMRNAAALGADGVVVASTCADPFSRRAVRVSMGNVFKLRWCYAEGRWPYGLFDALRSEGYTTLALALDERAVALDSLAVGEGDKLALFFGAEGTGLTRPVLANTDHTVVIPMSAGVDSLNVAASSAVTLWELFCRRG